MLWILFLTTPLYALQEIYLGVKEHRTFSASAESEIFVQDRAILKITEKASSILVTGKKSGTSQLTINGRRYRFRVLSKKKVATVSQLRSQLKSYRGLKVSWVDGKIAVVGQLKGSAPLPRVAIDGEFNWRLTLSPRQVRETENWLHPLLERNALPRLNIYTDPKLHVLVSGRKKETLKRLRRLLKPLGIAVVLDSGLLTPSPLVELSISIVEVKKGQLQKYGVEWPDALEARLLPAPVFSAEDAPYFSIHARESDGESKVLASPTLLCRSGKKAQFLSGGEIPILSGHLGRNVIWKKHGVQLEFEPKVDPRGHLHLKLRTEVSAPDFSTAVNGIPGFSSNQISTEFGLTEPRTILISGLIKRDSSKNRQGLPFLQRLPILGPLFGSRSFQSGETELVIFVRPRILSEASP